MRDEEERLRREGLAGARESARAAGLGEAEASIAEAEGALRRRREELESRQRDLDLKTRRGAPLGFAALRCEAHCGGGSSRDAGCQMSQLPSASVTCT